MLRHDGKLLGSLSQLHQIKAQVQQVVLAHITNTCIGDVNVEGASGSLQIVYELLLVVVEQEVQVLT